MNRAWIPAGALAGVSVAGLIALGPLTDSLGNQVSFPTEVKTAGAANPASKPARSEVPVSIILSNPVGKVETAALTRGGKATASRANATEGLVGFKVRAGSSVTSQSATTTHSSTTTHKAATPTVKPKKAPVKRRTSLGGISESNSDQGLAGQSQGTSQGEQSVSPAP
jgi:hypothetical protein